MTKYIDADKLFLDINDTEFWEQHDKDVAMRCVQIAETADVQEVKRGKWIDYGWHPNSIEGSAHFYKCSICAHNKIGMSNYCPRCGARMDGDER